MSARKRWALIPAVALMFTAAACGSDDDKAADTTAAATTTAAAATTAAVETTTAGTDATTPATEATESTEATSDSSGDSTDASTADSTDATDASTPASDAATTAGGSEGEANTPAPQPLAEREKVVLEYSAPIEAWANVLLAVEFGEFEKENLDVEIQTISGPDGLVLLSQGKADVQTAGASAALMNAVAADQPVRLVANTFIKDAPDAGFWISNDYLTADGKPDVDKLKGSQVVPGIGGGGFGNPGALPLWNKMQELGLGANDLVPITVTSPADAAQALTGGQVSISLGLTPFWAQIKDSGCCTFLVPTVVSGSFLANENFLNDRPEVAEAFFRALMRTNRTYLQGDYHQDADVVAALSKQTTIPAETIAAQPSLVFSPDLELTVGEVLPQFQAQFRTFELLSYDEDLPVEDLVDTSVIDSILAAG